MDWKTCPYTSLNFVKSHTRTHFFCNLDTRHNISSFISALEGLATQSKAKLKSSFIEVETAIKIKLSSVLGQLNPRHNQRERVIHFEDDE